MEARDVLRATEQIRNALTKILAPTTGAEDRKAASEFVENFQENSDLCAVCGFALFSDYNCDPSIRHNGLKMAQSFVRRKWNNLPLHVKDEFKVKALSRIVEAQFSEPGHLKDALAKFVVELIKREWPQHWKSLFADLSGVTQRGDAQVEMVLLVLLRLAEDVVSFDDNLKQNRRKDMLQSLTYNIEDLLFFFLSTLSRNFEMYQEQGHRVHYRLCEAALFTLQGYLSWIQIQHIFYDDNKLLHTVCVILKDPKLRDAALDCLLIAFSRKGNVHPRLGFLILFSDDAMNMFDELARKALAAEVNEENHKFLIKLTEALASLGYIQLAGIWDENKGINKSPENFDKYLQIIITLTNHPSLAIGIECMHVWASFFKHEQISKEKALRDCVPQLLLALWNSVSKFGHPSKNNHPRCIYSKLELDSDEEFVAEFSHFRYYLNANIEEISGLYPAEVFQETLKLFLSSIKEPKSTYLESITDGNKAVDYLIWDGISTFLLHVLRKIGNMVEVWADPVVSAALLETEKRFLQLLLDYDSKVPLIMECVISCLVSLVPVLKYQLDAIPGILQKMFSTMGFTTDPEMKELLKAVYTKQVYILTRHSASCFLDLCKQIPFHLQIYYDDMEKQTMEVFDKNPGKRYEKLTCMEGLLLLSQSFEDNSRQKNLLAKMFEPVIAYFQSDTVVGAMNDIGTFMNFLGLNQAPSDYHRTVTAQLDNMINIIFSTVRRCKIAVEDENADILATDGSVMTEKYPWIQLLIPLVPGLFLFMRQLLLLWKPENRILVHESHRKIFDLSVSEKCSILGFTAASTDEIANEEGLQCMLRAVYDSLCNLLGRCTMCLGQKFYCIENVDQMILKCVVEAWCWLPKWRLRGIHRLFIKQFLNHCPKEKYESLVAPVMGNVIEYMFVYFDQEWRLIVESKGNRAELEEVELHVDMVHENQIKEEILEERALYHLHKDYMDILVNASVLRNSKANESAVIIQLADLGNFFIENEATGKAYVFTIFSSMAWPNFGVVNKLTGLIPKIIEKIAQVCVRTSIDPGIVENLFVCLIKGLAIHGVDTSTCGNIMQLAFQYYVTLRPYFPSLANIMLSIPTCTQEKLRSFELVISDAEPTVTLKVDKKPRDAFKKLLSGAIQKSVSEWYKQNVNIADLPPLAPRKKPPPPDVVADGEDGGLCILFAEES